MPELIITHKMLVNYARKWLRRHCYIVITEMAGGCSEQPDVFGWGSRGSYLIECKASITDFNADKKKLCRKSKHGLGKKRYYLTCKGLISPDKIPEKWGLLELVGKRIFEVKSPQEFYDIGLGGELGIAISLIRRIGQEANLKGCNIKAYTYGNDNRPRASVGIKKDV